MSQKPHSRRTLLIILLIVILIAIAAGMYYWQSARLKRARLEATNPAVFILQPDQGTSATTGSWIPVTASATGPRLLRSIEIWINGSLVEIQESSLPEGEGVIYGHFALLVQEGAQTFVVRAIDVEGFVGQSDPVSISGFSRAEEDQPSMLVPFGPESSLEMIAFDYQVPIEEIINLNPDALSQTEGVLRVPINPSEENTPVSPDQVPQDLITQNGYVSGKVCYPSQYIPAMTAYFKNSNSGQITTLPISLNQNTYGISLPPGSYTAYAWLPDYSLGGSYSKAVPCGLTTSCTDHKPLEFQVQAGTCTKGIDICDWYDQPSVPTAPNAPSSPTVPSGPEIVTAIPMLTPKQVFPDINNVKLPFAVLIPTLPPGVPSNINVRTDQCKIKIGWDTPGTDLDGYAVWLSGQTGSKHLVAKLKPGDSSYKNAWYEFTSPQAGLISVWVEAFNSVGSTASPAATLKIPEKCDPASKDDLELETLELYVGGGYNNVYLYLSVEGIPEERLPADDSVFLAVQEGTAEFSGVNQVITLPKPDDGTLTISGECWGWAGDTPIKISSFSESIPESSWSGYEKEVGNQDCGLNLNLKPKEDINNYQTMAGKGTKILAPYDVQSKQNKFYESSLDPYEEWSWFWEREITWKWQGPKDSITGFTIYHNGKKIATAPVTDRSATVVLPGWCGDEVRWRVVANGVKGQSPSSPIVKEMLPSCGKYAEVIFDDMCLIESCDECCCDYFHTYPFDTLEAYFFLTVNSVTRQEWGGNWFVDMKKGCFDFKFKVKHQGHQRFIVLAYKEPISLKISTKFYDHDNDSSDDLFGAHVQIWDFKTFNDALKTFGNSNGSYNPVGVSKKTGTSYTDTAEDWIRYRVWFYKSKSTQ